MDLSRPDLASARARLAGGWLAVLGAVLLATTPAFAEDTLLDGTLAPGKQASLKARVDGLLQVVYVKAGDPVRKDQTLARVANARLDEDVRQAEARDLEAEATARTRRQQALAALDRAALHRADLEAALARVQADHNLAARVIVSRDLRMAADDEGNRKRELRACERALEQAATQANGRAARDRARMLEELRSPFDATVMQVGAQAGMRVTPASPAIFALAQLEPMVLVADAPAASFRYVPDHGTAVVTVDEVPGKTFAGTVTNLDTVYSPPTARLTVTLAVGNPRGLLRPGMHAHAALQLAPQPQRPEVEIPQPELATR